MIHPTAMVHPDTMIGQNTTIWQHAQILAGVRIGDECIVGSLVYVDRDVVVGNRVKIQTAVQLYRGTTIEDGVFLGPNVCLTNDKRPRAITPDGRLKGNLDWVCGRARVRYGASLGAGVIVLPDVAIGRFALVGAGALVTADVPDHGLVVGSPARLVGYVCACGASLRQSTSHRWSCVDCGELYLAIANGGLGLARDLPGVSKVQPSVAKRA
jgi:UDP-2-acetamido-3-amino-2,3-dideoxy-glucuronate N-acetyltransferase